MWSSLRRPWIVPAVVLASALPGLGQEKRRFDPARDRMELAAVRNGFGQLLPLRIPVPDDDGLPTGEIVEIRSARELAHVRPTNPVLPVATWPAAAVLPSAVPGNHYVQVRFRRPIDVDSVLTGAVSAIPENNLLGTIRVLALNPLTSVAVPVRGRAFIGGRTYGSVDPADPTRLAFEHWVELDAAGLPRALPVAGHHPGLGFPGTESTAPYPGLRSLVADDALVFVADTDGDLTTHETFPAGYQIQVRISPGVRGTLGGLFDSTALASSTVGPDTLSPEVAGSLQPEIEPPDGATGVDPATHVFVTCTEALQPLSVGSVDESVPPALSASIQLLWGPLASRVSVPFHVRFPSLLDLSRVELVPAYAFPGGPSCGGVLGVVVRVNAGELADLADNRNLVSRSSSFVTADGQGLVNAPVTPDAIYVARGASLSVVDLNGFGQSTGDPTYDVAHPIVQGNSNFPNNPNVAIQGSLMVPPLAPGTCTFDGGSAGVFTLTRDSRLSDELIGPPQLESVGDMALGHALDLTFNDGSPTGCQAGGGNLCAGTGLKLLSIRQGGPNSLAPTTPGTIPVKIAFGAENPVSWAPHPNPPALSFPPLCLSPLLLGEEPTSVVTSLPPPDGPGLTNLLVPGPNFLGNPALERPPTNLLAREQNTFFQGPSAPQPAVQLCRQFALRQKIGHFLYVADRSAGELVVLDSNRFTVLDRIELADPTALAMSPNLDFLAVSQEGADQVSFVDVDPLSATFHQVVRATPVGRGPLGLAWEPGNEDVLVCNRGDGTVSVISAFTLHVRKVVQDAGKARAIDGRLLPERFPFDVVITPRQLGFGFQRGVYFAYILNTDGSLSLFESGPDGVNGWGYDDIVATLPFPFFRARTLQPSVADLESAVYVLHENPLGPDGQPTGQTGGAVTKVGIVGGVSGVLTLGADALARPHLRLLQLGVRSSIGEGTQGLSGVPVDLALDDQLNLTALTNFTTQFSAGQPLSVNGKSLVRVLQGTILPASAPAFLFLAVPSANAVDVIELSSGLHTRVDTDVFQPGIQSIPVPGVSGLMSYFRQ